MTKISNNGSLFRGCLVALVGVWAFGTRLAVAEEPSMYVVDFVSTAAFGSAMNDAGDAAGTSYTDPGCGSTCLPPLQTVVWRNGVRIILPIPPGFSTITVRSINASGWLAGFAGDPSTGSHAVVWRPVGAGYEAMDIGAFPGTTISTAAGIDDLGRVVGFSTTQNFPPTSVTFQWTEGGGMVDLTDLGFPNESPLFLSSGGTVATPSSWYDLDDPGNVHPLAPPPPHFSGPGSYPAAVNDAGDQVRFQISTSTEFFPYLFRYENQGTWKQIWAAPAGHLAPYGVGSITRGGDITATVGGIGLIAYGPSAPAQPLAGKLSPAYGGGDVTIGGPINSFGEILAQLMVGRSPRLVRLVPVEVCTSGCLRVASIRMTGRMIGRPRGQCTPDAFNRVAASITVTDEGGRPLRGVTVEGRFLDDYWTDAPVRGTTNWRGIARFVHTGPPCVGAVAFFVDDASRLGRVLDRGTGQLTSFVIPQP